MTLLQNYQLILRSKLRGIQPQAIKPAIKYLTANYFQSSSSAIDCPQNPLKSPLTPLSQRGEHISPFEKGDQGGFIAIPAKPKEHSSLLYPQSFQVVTMKNLDYKHS